MKRCLLSLVLAFSLVLPAVAQEKLRVGFRADAPPFSSLGDDGYEGFLVDLCRGAFAGRELTIEPVDVSAADRFDQLRLGGAAGGVDVLCDPTSVQTHVLIHFIVSPLVFATGVGYLRHLSPTHESPDVIVGHLAGTTSSSAVEIARKTQAIEPRKNGKILLREVLTHHEGIALVCVGEIEYYFGDLDILHALRAKAGDCPDVAESEKTFFSYEAYTLPVNRNRSDIAILLQIGLYRMFSDGTVQKLYTDHFGTRTRSGPLNAVFALNGALPCQGVIADDPCKKLGGPAAEQ